MISPDGWSKMVEHVLSSVESAAGRFGIEESRVGRAGIVVVVVRHEAEGGFVSMVMGATKSTRGYALGIAERPEITSGMYTGQGWHRRLIADAWKALDDVATGSGPPHRTRSGT